MLKHLFNKWGNQKQIQEDNGEWQNVWNQMCPRKCLIFSSWNGDIQQTQSRSDPFKTLDQLPPLLETFSWLRLTQLRINSSPQSSRSCVIGLLSVTSLLHSLWSSKSGLFVASWTRQACSQLCTSCSPLLEHSSSHLQQVFFQMSPAQTHPDYPNRNAARTPYSPSLLSSRVPSNTLMTSYYVDLHSQGKDFENLLCLLV